MSLVSIVTPTIPGREDVLLERCVPSVRAQVWPVGQHVIVSDRNPSLAQYFAGDPNVTFVQLNETWRDGVRERSVGAVPWHVGSLLALGEFVGFLGDDDELLPDHVVRHVNRLIATGADFTVSAVQFRVAGEDRLLIGDDSFAHGHLDSDGIMCRSTALRTANWTATGEDAADHRLVADWRAAGLRGEFLGGAPTAVHHDGWLARQ